jgi:hypothetical protein
MRAPKTMTGIVAWDSIHPDGASPCKLLEKPMMLNTFNFTVDSLLARDYSVFEHVQYISFGEERL